MLWGWGMNARNQMNGLAARKHLGGYELHTETHTPPPRCTYKIYFTSYKVFCTLGKWCKICSDICSLTPSSSTFHQNLLQRSQRDRQTHFPSCAHPLFELCVLLLPYNFCPSFIYAHFAFLLDLHLTLFQASVSFFPAAGLSSRLLH